ncbi:Na+/H+ antiporter [Agromyces sp. MMS17-SY077]|uniref:Na+/H+ antiporter n=2 Tax=Agromyces seonyuensis TaxID=2662446 RepID=A0A6I4NTP4_9MICO|nr:Na+/H+ antiporter [Agromyces seonyuensis]MWB97816.1 Na+/H+ antiporter [Agromyces seonyuensis]
MVVVVGIAVLAAAAGERRTRIASPVLLVAVGILLAFAPMLDGFHLDPDVVLLWFLPVLLYWESLTISLRGIRRDLWTIVLASTVLVVLSAAVVAVIAHAFGLPWGPAWVLGAAVAPTDATATAALAKALPQRNLTLLRAESLVNDGTALVLYGIAIAATVSEHALGPLEISGMFVLAYAGGAIVGFAIGWVGLRVRNRFVDPSLNTVAHVLVPFTAYLVAELISASGVIAVVVAGIFMGRAGPRRNTPEARQQTTSVFVFASLVINGSLFVLVGLEMNADTRAVPAASLGTACLLAVAVWLALVLVRMAFQFLSGLLIGAFDHGPHREDHRLGPRARVVSGLAGFRGAVSLAAALGIPMVLDDGSAFPDRAVIVFAAAGVILLTLAVQAPLLPWLVRWARFPADNLALEERRLAQSTAIAETLAALPELVAGLGVGDAARERVQRELERQRRVLDAQGVERPADDDVELVRGHEDYRRLKLAVLEQQRAVVLRLRDQQTIDDTVLRRIQAQLDAEEVRFTGRTILD